MMAACGAFRLPAIAVGDHSFLLAEAPSREG